MFPKFVNQLTAKLQTLFSIGDKIFHQRKISSAIFFFSILKIHRTLKKVLIFMTIVF